MKLTITVVQPATVELEISEHEANQIRRGHPETVERIRNLAFDQAEKIFESSGINFLIADSSIPELID